MKTYRMTGLGLVAGLAFAAASANAQIKNAPAGTMAKADQNFMNEAIEGDSFRDQYGKTGAAERPEPRHQTVRPDARAGS